MTNRNGDTLIQMIRKEKKRMMYEIRLSGSRMRNKKGEHLV